MKNTGQHDLTCDPTQPATRLICLKMTRLDPQTRLTRPDPPVLPRLSGTTIEQEGAPMVAAYKMKRERERELMGLERSK